MKRRKVINRGKTTRCRIFLRPVSIAINIIRKKLRKPSRKKNTMKRRRPRKSSRRCKISQVMLGLSQTLTVEVR